MQHEHDHTDPWDRGLAADLQTMLDRRLARRSMLGLLAGAGAAGVLAACGSDSQSASTTAAADTTAATSSASTASTAADSVATTAAGSAGSSASGTCSTAIPEETAGPYPGDGSNGPNILSNPDVLRRDITGSFGDFTGTAEGVAATVTLTILDSSGCAPMDGAAVYLWHADRDGHYSMYSAPDANYLRGVQVAGTDGVLAFDTIFPGCYDGRWPHMHFEIYSSVDDALGGGTPLRTTQLAVPKAACDAAYQADGYSASVTNLSRTSLDTDMVFGDGYSTQIATVTGDNAAGYQMSLSVSV